MSKPTAKEHQQPLSPTNLSLLGILSENGAAVRRGRTRFWRGTGYLRRTSAGTGPGPKLEPSSTRTSSRIRQLGHFTAGPPPNAAALARLREPPQKRSSSFVSAAI